ncbi:MAG: YegP family protein [Clostridia bacterium]|nr:YegP family protein [Clostridia bacterium]
MGKFAIKPTTKGFKFNLKANNGEIIATSQVYASLKTCQAGCDSVKRNAVKANLEDQTVADFAAAKHPKFEVYLDKAGEYRFRLKATNGQNICASEGYKSRTSCLNGIESIKRNAPEANIIVEKAD